MAVANTHSKWTNGAQVWYPEGNEQRWLDAHGDMVVKYLEDFNLCPRSTNAAAAANNPEWIITHTSGGTGSSLVQASDTRGGVLNISPASSEDDGINMQHQGTAYSMPTASTSPIYFGVRYKLDSATQSDFIVGLVEKETAVIDGSSHGIYFKTTDGGTYVKLGVAKDGTTDTTNVMTTGLAADVWYIDEFIAWSTGLVECWHNGAYIGSVTAGIPSTDMAVTIAYETGASNTSDDFYVDWIRAIQIVSARAT
jgi:hypothetical protein